MASVWRLATALEERYNQVGSTLPRQKRLQDAWRPDLAESFAVWGWVVALAPASTLSFLHPSRSAPIGRL
jgi:hypothetical protein